MGDCWLSCPTLAHIPAVQQRRNLTGNPAGSDAYGLVGIHIQLSSTTSGNGWEKVVGLPWRATGGSDEPKSQT